MNEFKPCIVIPCYNHESSLEKMLNLLSPFNLSLFIIDDGSHSTAAEIIKNCVEKFPHATLYRRTENGGKGAAVKDGLELAKTKGFSHVLQIDADCQHTVADIPDFLNLSQQNPGAIILGQAIYDESVPKSRLYGRYITHFWVMIETLSTSVTDTMCGFRIYPLRELAKINLTKIGKRMDFDVEIIVKAIWQEIPIVKKPTKVIYPENGISNFHYFKSNVRISFMHTKLFFGMLLRLPLLLWHKVKKWTKK